MDEPKDKSVPELNKNLVYAYIRLDKEGIIRAWNSGAKRILGYDPAEVIGERIEVIFTPEDNEQNTSEKELQNALRFGFTEDERWHVKRDGSQFWASGALTTIEDENAEVVGFEKIFRNRTPQKKTEDEMRFANAELNRFSEMVSHDLQQPLRTVISFFELAFRKNELHMDSDSKEYVRIALDAAHRMRALIGDLLAYAQSKSRSACLESVECNAVFDIAVANLKDQILSTRAIVTRGALPVLPGVPLQVVSLLQNLISNALQYRKTTVPPKVNVSAEKEEGFWHFTVVDNGVGIAEKDRARVFKTFERGAFDDDSHPGSGLGLAICRNIVEQHGGKIWVESQVDEGSSFHFTLKAS